jgi:Flp pilus assembly protein TadG
MKRLLRRNRRGQTLVEFALIFPLFALILFGLFDMGRAVLYFSTISNASREAVRLAIVDQTIPLIQQEAVDSAEAVMSLSTGDVTVTFLAPDLTATGTCPATPGIGCVAMVRIEYQFLPATPFVGILQLGAETHQVIEH